MKKMNNFLILLSLILLVDLFTLGAAQMVDPTKPPQVILLPNKTNEPQTLKLTAIFIYPHDKFAIINGTSVKVGEHFGDLTITAITPISVELTDSQNSKQILLLTNKVRQESN